MDCCLPDPVIYFTSSTVFDPALVSRFMVISAFHMFAIVFGFPNRLVVVPLSIIIISIKYDSSFVTCLLP